MWCTHAVPNPQGLRWQPRCFGARQRAAAALAAALELGKLRRQVLAPLRRRGQLLLQLKAPSGVLLAQLPQLQLPAGARQGAALQRRPISGRAKRQALRLLAACMRRSSKVALRCAIQYHRSS